MLAVIFFFCRWLMIIWSFYRMYWRLDEYVDTCFGPCPCFFAQWQCIMNLYF